MDKTKHEQTQRQIFCSGIDRNGNRVEIIKDSIKWTSQGKKDLPKTRTKRKSNLLESWLKFEDWFNMKFGWFFTNGMKLFLIALSLFSGLCTEAQIHNRPSDPDRNHGIIYGYNNYFSRKDGLEASVLFGVNLKDRITLAVYGESDLSGKNSFGSYVHYNLFAKTHYVCLAPFVRTGLVNKNFLYQEWGGAFHVNLNDNVRFTSELSMHNTEFLPNLRLGFIIGNFGEKWWLK